MKKIITFILIILTAFSCFSLTAFADTWETPELALTAIYDEEKGEITLYYDVLNFAGTESADFRLQFNPDVVTYVESEKIKINNTLVEVGESKEGTMAIQFANMTHVLPENCKEDGSATVCTFTFEVKDNTAKETVFISTTDSYNMDPDSAEIKPDRATLKIPLNNGNQQLSTFKCCTFTSNDKKNPYSYSEDASETNTDNDADFSSEKMTKVIILTVLSALVFIGGIVAVVIKYRKPEEENKLTEKKKK